jgi:hypothetical protein
MMKWTSEAEAAMKKSGVAGLEVFYARLEKHVSKFFAYSPGMIEIRTDT